MKTLRFMTVGFVFAVVFAVSAFAQTTTSSKIGLINTLAFDSKEGITKYINAMNALEKEFQLDNTSLQTLGTKIKTLQTEIQTLQKQVQDGKVPVDEKTVNAKLEEYEKLTREYKFKEDDAKVRFTRREQVVMSPVRQDIGKAIQDFATKNGYLLILDAA
ncbi:MAG: OmpH family outer membrane protein, partial [Pyrinomonadaceae bacterium]